MDGKAAVERLQKRYKQQNEWTKTHRDKYTLTMPLGTKDRIRTAAKESGESINNFINVAIEERLARLDASNHQDEKEDA